MKSLLAGSALALALLTSPVIAQGMAPFGTEHDVGYAGLVWKAMEAANLVGDHAIKSRPYDGTPPHGKMLETFYTTATVDGHTGTLIVKRNYGPEGVDAEQIMMDPGKHLGAITVMFQREAGYDEDNQNWFWAKFLPDGSLDKNAKGMQLAGRVAKGADKGCIACHSTQDDYIFTTDAIGPAMQ